MLSDSGSEALMVAMVEPTLMFSAKLLAAIVAEPVGASLMLVTVTETPCADVCVPSLTFTVKS